MTIGSSTFEEASFIIIKDWLSSNGHNFNCILIAKQKKFLDGSDVLEWQPEENITTYLDRQFQEDNSPAT